MARKHFEEYYGKIKSQYSSLLEKLKEADELASKNLVDPQVIDNLESIMQPVKNSYMTLAYIEYLLNLPKDKKVQKRNERQFKAALQKMDKSKLQSSVIKSNKDTLDKIDSIIEEELKWQEKKLLSILIYQKMN